MESKKGNPILYFRILDEDGIESPFLEETKFKVQQTLITRSREAADCSEHSDIPL